jgi:integrase
MAKITAQQVAALRPTDKPQRVVVDTGLQLRIATSGVKTWVVRYIVNGRLRDYRLPKPYGISSDSGHMSLAEARSEAAAIRALARQGIDVQIQAEEARVADSKRDEATLKLEAAGKVLAERDNLTFGHLFDAWLTDGVRRKDGNAELQRSFNADVLPKLGACRISDLTEHELRAVVSRGANRTAVIIRNNLTQLFAWAEKRQPWRKLLLDGNPMDLIEIEKIVSPDYDLDKQRDRILSPNEMRELARIFQRMQDDYDNSPDKRFGTQPIEATTQCAIWLMLSTMGRVGEMSMARWEHIDSAKWFIPKENVKDNVASLGIFLSPFALHQFRQLHEMSGHTDWCFPARNRDGHVDVKSISKQVGDRQTQFKKSRDGGPRRPMKNRRHDNTLVLGGGAHGAWTPHDLRRTGATIMQALGVPLDIIDRCQNHVLAGSKVRRHYLHHDYAQEKRTAWNQLGERIMEILRKQDPVGPSEPRS